MKVLVIGAGQMGSGIAQVAACAGLSVTMVDINDQAVQRGQATIARSLAKLSEKGISDLGRHFAGYSAGFVLQQLRRRQERVRSSKEGPFDL